MVLQNIKQLLVIQEQPPKKSIFLFIKPDGTIATRDIDVKYTVGVPSGLVVSTDKTRVFYQVSKTELRVTGGSGDEK